MRVAFKVKKSFEQKKIQLIAKSKISNVSQYARLQFFYLEKFWQNNDIGK